MKFRLLPRNSASDECPILRDEQSKPYSDSGLIVSFERQG
jgi:hypothetical protein